MLNNLQIFTSSIVQPKPVFKPVGTQQCKKLQQNLNRSEMLLNTLNCMGAISFGSLQSGLNKISLKGLEKFVVSELPAEYDKYRFLKRNPRGFYLECGREVNKFLRKGEFKELPAECEDMPPEVRAYLQKQVAEKKAFNRTIVESIDILDAQFTSKTSEPMTVFRDAPRQWMDTAKDAILTDAAYLSTSTERGASLEGVICNGADNFTYEIRLPKGTPFWDLTDTAEKEMLLPRGCKFKVIGDGILELIP